MFEQLYTMAGGERSESEPSDAEKLRKEIRADGIRGEAERMQSARRESIDSHIQSVNRTMSTPDNKHLSEYYEREIGIYTYLKDNFHARTVGDAETVLRQRQVPPNVVHMWIEEDLTGNTIRNPVINSPLLRHPIVDGYPEFDAEFQRIGKQNLDYIDRLFDKGDDNFT